MKKIFAVLLILCLLPLAGLGEERAASELYRSDFTKDTDGWYARSMGSAEVSVTAEGALRIEGRESDWNSPGRDFDLMPGEDYQLSVQVRQDEAASVRFMISIAHRSGETETYENLGNALAKRGEWTTVTGSWSASEYDSYVLYVETTGGPKLSFEMRDFTVTGHSFAAREEQKLPSLKEIYADAFDFGAAVTRSEAANRNRMDFYATQFGILTPGNEMKPDALIDVQRSWKLTEKDETAVALRFSSIIPLLEYARSHGLKVHGHVFVWHSQTPEAFFHERYAERLPLVSREVMLGRLRNFMQGVFDYLEENYPGVVVSYDVVNEAVEDATGRLRTSNWLKVVGPDYLERAFEIARECAPEGMLLYYNDYNTAFQPKLNGILSLLQTLQAEGNIDGYGFQMHHSVSSPTLKQIARAVETIAATGLLLRVSELDITVPNNSAQSFERQAEMYAGIMKILMPYKDQLEAVQVWGVTDNLSWRALGYPLLFDGNAEPKPAFWAVADRAAAESALPEAAPAAEPEAGGKPTAQAAWGANRFEETLAIPVEAESSDDAHEGGTVSAVGYASWDGEKLYVKVDVTDAYLNTRPANSYEQDSVEIFLDELCDSGEAYGPDDHHYRVNCDGVLTVDAGFNTVRATAERTENGYTALFEIPFTKEVSGTVGFDIRVNNAAKDGIRRMLNFADDTDSGWSDPSQFGRLTLRPAE